MPWAELLLWLIGASIATVAATEFAVRGIEPRIAARFAVSNLVQGRFAPDPLHGRVARMAHAGTLALLIVSGLLLVGGAAAWVALPALALALAFTLARWLCLGLTVVAASSSREIRTVAALNAPGMAGLRFGFHFSSPDLPFPSHVKMWQPELDAVGERYYVLLREAHHLPAFAAPDQPPTVFVEKADWLQWAVQPTTKVMFYANNAQRNRTFLSRYPQLTHVQLLHGDSDKPPSFSPLSANYDLLFVAGQMAIDRYARNGVHLPPERFRIVGRPQVRHIERARPRDPSQPLTVVYMPTWRGFFEDTQFSSLEIAARVIERLLAAPQALLVKFKPHPMSYMDPMWKTFQADIEQALEKGGPGGNKGVFCGSEADPTTLYNEADILVSDISSVVIDFLYSGKPFLVIRPRKLEGEVREAYPSTRGGYNVGFDLGNLDAALEMATGDDPMSPRREEIRSYAFGDANRDPGEAFQEACRALLQNPAALRPAGTETVRSVTVR